MKRKEVIPKIITNDAFLKTIAILSGQKYENLNN
jgi:hypothetical protein